MSGSASSPALKKGQPARRPLGRMVLQVAPIAVKRQPGEEPRAQSGETRAGSGPIHEIYSVHTVVIAWPEPRWERG